MLRKRTLKIVVAVFIVMILSCNGQNWGVDVPKAYLNHVVVSKVKYSRDSAEILTQLKNQIKTHVDFFESKEFFADTQILVDSIIYNPDSSKILIFLIVRESNLPTTSTR